MKRPHDVTAEHVRRVLLVLAADEVRLAGTAPRPLSVAILREHAGSHAFCRSLAREAASAPRVLAAEQSVAEHLRAVRRRS